MSVNKTLSKKEYELIKSVRSKIGKTVSRKKILKILRENGYIWVNSGGYKIVYRQPKGEYCIKVYRRLGDWKEDSYIVPKGISEHFLHPIYKNKRYMIQPWAKKTPGVKIKRLPDVVYNYVCDLHNENIKIHKDREVIVDFCN